MADNNNNNITRDWGIPIRYIALVTRQQQIDALSEILDGGPDENQLWKQFAVILGEKPAMLAKIQRMVNNTMKSGGKEILTNWQHTKQATIQNYISIFQKIDCDDAIILITRWIMDAPENVISKSHPLRKFVFLDNEPSNSGNQPAVPVAVQPSGKFDICLVEVGGIPDMDSAALPDYLFWSPTKKTLKIFFVEQHEFKNKVMETIPTWTDHCGIKFEETPNRDDADIRISFSGKASKSAIGRLANNVPKDQPTMFLAGLENLSDKEKKRTILHEFGHALGLIHEHQRPDIKIPWNLMNTFRYFKDYYGWDYETTVANVLQPKYDANYMLRFKTDFDPRSIMLYPCPADLLEPRDAQYEKWKALISDEEVYELSEGDKQIFKAFYKLK